MLFPAIDLFCAEIFEMTVRSVCVPRARIDFAREATLFAPRLR